MDRISTPGRTSFALTPARLAANRANAKKAGRPKGAVAPDTAALRAKCRAWTPKIVAEFARLALGSESEAIRIAAGRELLGYGYGRPVQMAAGGVGDGDGPVRWIVSWATSDDECRDVLAGLPPRD